MKTPAGLANHWDNPICRDGLATGLHQRQVGCSIRGKGSGGGFGGGGAYLQSTFRMEWAELTLQAMVIQREKLMLQVCNLYRRTLHQSTIRRCTLSDRGFDGL